MDLWTLSNNKTLNFYSLSLTISTDVDFAFCTLSA